MLINSDGLVVNDRFNKENKYKVYDTPITGFNKKIWNELNPESWEGVD